MSIIKAPISRFNLIIGLLSRNNLQPKWALEVEGCVKTITLYFLFCCENNQRVTILNERKDL